MMFFCGNELTENEVIEIRTRGQGYKYSSKDMEIHSEIAMLAQEIGGDSITMEIFFFLSNNKELGIYIFGPNDNNIIRKMSCAIMNIKYKHPIQPIIYILYYETNKEPLLLGVKN